MALELSHGLFVWFWFGLGFLFICLGFVLGGFVCMCFASPYYVCFVDISFLKRQVHSRHGLYYMLCVLLSGAGAVVLSLCLHLLVCGILIKICCHPDSSNKVECVVFTFLIVVFLWV